jgi:endonuclease/exonuclease/phosphatase family metal-dependent hydrolase
VPLPAAAADVDQLRVATFNVRHGRVGVHGPSVPWRLREGVAALDADIVGLQEVDRRVFRSWFVDQVELGRRAAAAADAVFGRARWFGPGGHYGNALLVRGGIGPREVVELPVEGGRERRIAIVADAIVRGRELTVAVTHLQNDHREALRQLDVLGRRLAGRPGPAVLLGDLNLRPDDVRLVTEPLGFTVAGGANSSGVDRPFQRIDHVVVRGFEVGAVHVPRPPVSDHRPVIAALRFSS